MFHSLQLDKIQITFDGGMTTMNFSQAAFVIQKSACVYSKKVRIHNFFGTACSLFQIFETGQASVWVLFFHNQKDHFAAFSIVLKQRASLLQVEYLYSLVYQVLDLLSSKK